MRAVQSIWTSERGWDRAPDKSDAQLVLAFGASGTVTKGESWNDLRRRHPGAILLGCSTGGEIHGCDVLDETLSATAINFDKTEIDAAQADVAQGSLEAGHSIGCQLARSNLKALFVLSDGTRTNGSDLVRGLRDAVGPQVVLVGGLAGDGPNFGTTYVGLNGQPSPGKVAAIGFYGDKLKVGHGSAGGWDVFGPERRITRAQANVLYELDGKPALDLYKRYLGPDADQLPGSALLFPLRIYPADKPEQAIVRTVVGIDEEARTMTFAGDMPQGHCAQLMRGNFDRLIQGAAHAAEQAQGDVQGERVAILVSCIGRKLLLGQRTREEVEAVQGVLGEATHLAGFYSYGEVSPHAVTGSDELHNQTMTITTLSEFGLTAVHKLVARQLRSAAKSDGSINIEALTALMMRTYDEFDRERRLTDRAAKLMEEELQEANAQVRRLAEQRLADTLESMPSPIAVLTPSHHIQSVNSAMAALGHSVTRSTLIGEAFPDLLRSLAPDSDAGTAVNRMLRSESLELAIGGRWYLCSAHRFTDGGLAVTFSDVTVLKERESVLAMARDAAESANRLKSQFLATMSHELRTPLNAILGFSEMIFSRVLGDGPGAWVRYFDYAKSIHASGDHLRLLISEVLDLSKIDSGAYRLSFEHCSIAELVADSTLLVRPQAERGQVRLLPLRTEGDIQIQADSRALKQVLVNLLSNAVKFTPKGGEVEVIASGGEDGIEVCVRDTGIGIAEEHKKSVFEPFHQGDAKIARRYEGTGLGLSIVRGIIEMHGGKVWLESEPHIGTQVFFRLPRGHTQARSAA